MRFDGVFFVLTIELLVFVGFLGDFEKKTINIVHFGCDAIALKVQKVCKNCLVMQSLYDEGFQAFPVGSFPLDNPTFILANDVSELKCQI